VQTPTLAMLVERELAIRDFVPEDYLEVVATFSPLHPVGCLEASRVSRSESPEEKQRYRGTWFRPGAAKHPQRLPPSGEEAKAVVARALAGAARIASVTSQTKRLPPPLLYDLTELQRHVNRLYGLSAQRTLEVLQSLYEKHKLLSYPRTDSRHLSSDIAGTLPTVVKAIAAPYTALLAEGTGERALPRRFVDDAKVTDHHAIIPTATSAAGCALSGDEQRVYALVCRRLLQAWHQDFVWAATEVITEVHPRTPATEPVDSYRSLGTAIEQQGWKVLDLGDPKPPREKGAKSAAASDQERASGESVLPPGLSRGSRRTRPPASAFSPNEIRRPTSPSRPRCRAASRLRKHQCS